MGLYSEDSFLFNNQMVIQLLLFEKKRIIICVSRYIWILIRVHIYILCRDIYILCRHIYILCRDIYILCRDVFILCRLIYIICRDICILCRLIYILCRDVVILCRHIYILCGVIYAFYVDTYIKCMHILKTGTCVASSLTWQSLPTATTKN